MFLRSAVSWLAFFSLCFLVAAFQTSVLIAAPAVIDDGKSIDLADTGKLYIADDASFPERAQDIPSLLMQLKPATKVNLFGGGYWLYAELRQSSPVTEWVLDPNNTLIDRVEARIYAPDGSVQRVLTGYRHDHQYMLHYGKSITLQPNVDYRVLIKFSSPYFASNPRFEVWTEASYRAKVFGDNILIVGCLGAVA